MKLAATVKSLYIRKRIKLIVIVALMFTCQLLLSQNEVYKQYYNNTSLSDALLETAKHFNVKVAFDAQSAGQIIIDKQVSGNTPDEFISNLLSETGYSYQYKHNQFLIFEKKTDEEERADEYNEIIGTIVDCESKEQLPFATVQLPAQNLIVPATSSGSFYAKLAKTNKVRVLVNYIGYYSIDTVINCQVSPCHCVIALKPKSQSIELVEVREPRLEMVDFRNNVDFATTINPSKLNDLPSLAETDIFRALQLLSGISYSENSSELNIRGGSGDQNLVLFDGQTLYNLGHFYGVFSSINPSVVKDIQVFKGGYDSRYGERVSGIIDITGKSGNQLKPMVYGSINLISGNLVAEVPIGKKLTVVVAGRRSYADIYSTSLVDSYIKKKASNLQGIMGNNSVSTTPDFYFYDYNAKATYRISDNENVSVGVIGGKDYINNAYVLSSDYYNNDRSDSSTRQNYGINGAWTKQWNGEFYSSVQIGSSGYTNENYGNSQSSEVNFIGKGKGLSPLINMLENNYNTNTLSDVSFAIKNIWYFNNQHQLDFGILERQNKVYYHNDVDTNLFAGPVLLRDSINRTAVVSSFYAQDRISITDRFSVKPGFRINYYSGNKKFYLEPRFSIGYKITDELSVRFATGKFNQFIGQAISQQESGYNKSFLLLSDESIRPVMQSNHYIVGTTYETDNFLFDIEAYYKNTSGIQEYIQISPNDPNVGQFRTSRQYRTSGYLVVDSTTPLMQDTSIVTLKPSYFFTGSGKSYGLDFSLRYKYKNFTSWLSYSLSKSVNTYPELNYGQETYAPTDQTHQLSFANMLEIGKWNFGTITLFSTGRPYIYSTDSINNLPVIRYYKRMPNYFRCDISANYNFNVKGVKFKTGITIINIFNTQNVYDININWNKPFERQFQNTTDPEINTIKAQNLSFNVFLHFLF
jgi:ferric enterobactin receptor